MSPSYNPKESQVIATPLSVRWREFRCSTLPKLVIVSVIALSVLVWKNMVVPVPIGACMQTVETKATSSGPGWLADLW